MISPVESYGAGDGEDDFEVEEGPDQGLDDIAEMTRSMTSLESMVFCLFHGLDFLTSYKEHRRMEQLRPEVEDRMRSSVPDGTILAALTSAQKKYCQQVQGGVLVDTGKVAEGVELRVEMIVQ